MNDENEELVTCDACQGRGGHDASTDCEAYDDWRECTYCAGTGEIDANIDVFIPERDGFTTND